MQLLNRIVRRWLTRCGYAVVPLQGPPPSNLHDYLAGFARTAPVPEAIVTFDGDSQIQSEFIRAFTTEQIIPMAVPGAPPAKLLRSAGPAGLLPFAAAIDGDRFTLDRLAQEAPWIFAAATLFLRLTLGSFWSGHADLQTLAEALRARGFEFREFLHPAQAAALTAPTDSVICVFCAGSAPTPDPAAGRSRRQRTHSARAHLSAPLAQASQFRNLTGRGSLGFPGGVLNPGAILENGQIIAVARGERASWVVQKRDAGVFLTSCCPVLLTVDPAIGLTSSAELSVTPTGAGENVRFEDFRLFRHGGRLFANHSVISVPQAPGGKRRAVDLPRLRARVGLSEVDLAHQRITFMGYPQLDRSPAPMEKNWAMFSHEDSVALIYSVAPYKLYRAKAWPAMQFTPAAQAAVALPFAGDGHFLRNSVNPVVYDRDHLLHVVHKVYPGKQYVFWAILVDRRTLQPSRVSARPLVRGWPSAPAAIIYVCSVVVRDADVLLFAGLNDSSAGYWQISRACLDQEWAPLAAAAPSPA